MSGWKKYIYDSNQAITFGEIPKRPKGLPWKGSRSLIAARGFKSLFLRLEVTKVASIFFASSKRRKTDWKNVKKPRKKVLTWILIYVILIFAAEKRRQKPWIYKGFQCWLWELLRKTLKKDFKKNEKSCWQTSLKVIRYRSCRWWNKSEKQQEQW